MDWLGYNIKDLSRQHQFYLGLTLYASYLTFQLASKNIVNASRILEVCMLNIALAFDTLMP